MSVQDNNQFGTNAFFLCRLEFFVWNWNNHVLILLFEILYKANSIGYISSFVNSRLRKSKVIVVNVECVLCIFSCFLFFYAMTLQLSVYFSLEFECLFVIGRFLLYFFFKCDKMMENFELQVQISYHVSHKLLFVLLYMLDCRIYHDKYMHRYNLGLACLVLCLNIK